MLELLKVVLGSIIILGGIGYVGNDCTLPDLSYEEEIVEEVVEPTELVVEQKDKDIVYLEEIETKLEGMNAIEIQQYLGKHNIQYKLEKLDFYQTWDENREPYIYYHWKISVVEGKHEFYADWYDKKGNVEIFTIGVQEVDN